MTLRSKCLSCEHWKVSSNTKHRCKGWVWWVRQAGDRWIPEAHWASDWANWCAPGWMRDPVSKKLGGGRGRHMTSVSVLYTKNKRSYSNIRAYATHKRKWRTPNSHHVKNKWIYCQWYNENSPLWKWTVECLLLKCVCVINNAIILKMISDEI